MYSDERSGYFKSFFPARYIERRAVSRKFHVTKFHVRRFSASDRNFIAFRPFVYSFSADRFARYNRKPADFQIFYRFFFFGDNIFNRLKSFYMLRRDARYDGNIGPNYFAERFYIADPSCARFRDKNLRIRVYIFYRQTNSYRRIKRFRRCNRLIIVFQKFVQIAFGSRFTETARNENHFEIFIFRKFLFCPAYRKQVLYTVVRIINRSAEDKRKRDKRNRNRRYRQSVRKQIKALRKKKHARVYCEKK